MFNPSIFREYDIRGIAETELQSADVTDLGRALGTLLQRRSGSKRISLGRDCRLVRFDPAHRRLSERAWTGDIEAENRFTDGFPLLAVNSASLADLNARLAQPLPMNRFRPNIVLEGLDAFDEDRIQELRAGDIRLQFAKPCTRCAKRLGVSGLLM